MKTGLPSSEGSHWTLIGYVVVSGPVVVVGASNRIGNAKIVEISKKIVNVKIVNLAIFSPFNVFLLCFKTNE